VNARVGFAIVLVLACGAAARAQNGATPDAVARARHAETIAQVARTNAVLAQLLGNSRDIRQLVDDANAAARRRETMLAARQRRQAEQDSRDDTAHRLEVLSACAGAVQTLFILLEFGMLTKLNRYRCPNG
jgi:hypothetical protein